MGVFFCGGEEFCGRWREKVGSLHIAKRNPDEKMIGKCQCHNCGKQVEFEVEEFETGATTECPHCKASTPMRVNRWRTVVPAPGLAKRKDMKNVIALSYCAALIIPFVGFFCGLYLVTKKESGHGLTCVALSIVSFAVGAALILNW